MISRLLALLGLVAHIGNATTFRSAANDPWNKNDSLACVHRHLDERTDRCVALPARVAACGQRVVLVSLRTLRAVRSWVCERGPRRALIDLTPRLARSFGSHGHEHSLLLLLPLED